MNQATIQNLMGNWVARESFTTLAEVRVIDPASSWEWYIFAINPEYPDEIMVVVNGWELTVEQLSYTELTEMRNLFGDELEVDNSYRPMPVHKIITELKAKRGEYVT